MAHSSQVNDLGESSGPHARKRARNRKKLTQAYLATFWMQRAAPRSHFNTKTKYLPLFVFELNLITGFWTVI